MKVYTCFPDGKAKALTMSYDDGKVQDERLIQIFDKYGIKGTFNLNYGQMGNPPRIPAERIAELYKNHEVATHTMTHPTIERCPLVGVTSEIFEDRKGLEALTGKIVRGHAYPNGSYSEEIKQLLKQLGIAYARVVDSVDSDVVLTDPMQTIAAFKLPTDLYEWHPTCHHNDPRLMEIAEFFANFQKKQYMKLMYVWGHSYEFDNDNNWEVIEEFCKYMGGRDDIWYATNIEIIDYMAAAKNLQFSANCERVYNPSVQSVWLQLDGNKYVEVKGGSLVDLTAVC